MRVYIAVFVLSFLLAIAVGQGSTERQMAESISKELLWEKITLDKSVSSSILLCAVCEKISDWGVGFTNSASVATFIEHAVDLICPIVTSYNKPECAGVITAMGPFLLGSIADRFVSRDELCGYELKVCSLPERTEDSYEDYKASLLQDKPNSVARSFVKSGESVKVAHISDIHVSLLYVVGGNMKCTFNICCIPEAGEPASPEDAAPKWGAYGCDAPFDIADSMADYINNEIKPDILLWTGDNPEHDIWMQSVSSNVDASTKLAQMFQSKLDPSIKVIPALGNHEQFPVDQYDPTGANSQETLNGLANAYKAWLTEEAFEGFKTDGNYVESLDDLDMDVIVFNTQEACDLTNWYLVSDSAQQQKVLSFVQQSLATSEKNGRKAFLVGHIPPGESQCVNKWTERYNVLMDRYQNTVRGQFYGHTHEDHFRVTRDIDDVNETANGIIWITGEAGTGDKNPSFRVFDFDTKTKEVVDYEKFWFNFTLANEIDAPVWKSNYVFLEEYELEDASPASMEKLGQRVVTDEEYAKKFNLNFLTMGQLSELETCDSDCRKGLGCPILYDHFPMQNQCLGKKGDFANFGAKALDWLQGPWYNQATPSAATNNAQEDSLDEVSTRSE